MRTYLGKFSAKQTHNNTKNTNHANIRYYANAVFGGTMHTIGIKELQTNPGKLSHALLHNEYMLITRRGEPLGVALPFGLPLLEHA